MQHQVGIKTDTDGRVVAFRGPQGPIEELKEVPRVKPQIRKELPALRTVQLMRMG